MPRNSMTKTGSPDVWLATISGVAHMVSMEAPTRFADAMLDFLNERMA